MLLPICLYHRDACRSAEGKLVFEPHELSPQPLAVIGARACDLAAMAIQDKVFLQKKHVDTQYKARRDSLFIIAVNCTYSSQNCFCVSAGHGPQVKQAYDILLTEIEDGFEIQGGSPRGRDILSALHLESSKSQQQQQAAANIQYAAQLQTKKIPLENKRALRDLLFSNLNHPRWEDVANRI